MPYSMIEALATGLLVVASDIPGQRLVGQHVAACQLVGLDAPDIADGISRQLAALPAGSGEAELARRQLGDRIDLPAWGLAIVNTYIEAMEASRRHQT